MIILLQNQKYMIYLHNFMSVFWRSFQRSFTGYWLYIGEKEIDSKICISKNVHKLESCIKFNWQQKR